MAIVKVLCVEHSRGTWYVDKDGNIYTLLRFKNLLKRRNREYGSQAVDLESMAEYIVTGKHIKL